MNTKENPGLKSGRPSSNHLKIESDFRPTEPKWEEVWPATDESGEIYRAACKREWPIVVDYLIERNGLLPVNTTLVLEYVKNVAFKEMTERLMAIEGVVQSTVARGSFSSPRYKHYQDAIQNIAKLAGALRLNPATREKEEAPDESEKDFD